MIIANANDAIEYLKKGEVIGYPTEAVYGIGCDPWNKLGVEKVAKIKRRPLNKPFLMVASSIEQLDDLVDVTKLTNQVKLSWPGHTTWLIKAKRNVPSWLQDTESRKVGIRISSHPIVKNLCDLFKKPIISTSANISGEEEIKNQLDFKKNFSLKIKYLVDGKLGHYEKTSTIIDMESNKKIR
tara:strand:+ start:812 stop:1360 length:549 start_codon:yes stop_codon:yes gene_type:complete